MPASDGPSPSDPHPPSAGLISKVRGGFAGVPAGTLYPRVTGTGVAFHPSRVAGAGLYPSYLDLRPWQLEFESKPRAQATRN